MGCKWCTSGLGRKCEGQDGGDDIHSSCTCECHGETEFDGDGGNEYG